VIRSLVKELVVAPVKVVQGVTDAVGEVVDGPKPKKGTRR